MKRRAALVVGLGATVLSNVKGALLPGPKEEIS
jgi:hypothetical protein